MCHVEMLIQRPESCIYQFGPCTEHIQVLQMLLLWSVLNVIVAEHDLLDTIEENFFVLRAAKGE